MKRKYLILIGVGLLVVCSIFVLMTTSGTRPFKDLSADDIEEVTVKLLPPDIQLAVNESETEKLVEILNKVVTYQKDDSYIEYSGQAVIFTITKTNGTQITVNAYNPFIIIDGVGYKTKYEPCEELNHLANNLESGKEG